VEGVHSIRIAQMFYLCNMTCRKRIRRMGMCAMTSPMTGEVDLDRLTEDRM